LAQTWDLAGYPAAWGRIRRRIRIRISTSLTKKMDPKMAFLKRFAEETSCLQNEGVFKPGTTSLQDYIAKGHGDLEEGIRTTMRIGDLELLSTPEDSPDESAVDADFEFFYEGKMMKPLAQMLPTLTVCGTEETQPGSWRVLYDPDKSRLWALLRGLVTMKNAALVGCEIQGDRYQKIVSELLEALPVTIIKMKVEDELWAEWNRSQTAGHTDLQHSTDRNSVRFVFFSKLMQTMKKKSKDEGCPKEVTMKQLFAAYVDAEKDKKFTTAKGMTGVKRDNELSQLMKWGNFITKIGAMDVWKALEVLSEGKTAFFTPGFGSSFCGLVENNEDIAKYVLYTLSASMADEKWLKRVMEANAQRMKSIVRTLVLQWKWTKMLVESCKNRPIMPPEKEASDFAVIATAFSRTEAHQVIEDSTGKKANLHPLSLELWNTCYQVLCELAHFNTFQGAEAMNKNFQNTLQIEALQNLCVSNINNPWKDAHAQFAGHAKKMDAANHDDENEEDNTEKTNYTQLPSRKEAIKVAAKNELELYHGTSFVRTGDISQDRAKMFQSEIGKPRTEKNAQWNHETQGNRRGTM